jgi:hypothetical protein
MLTYRPASNYLTESWHRVAGSRLRIVMGSPDFAAAATFYSQDHPDAVPAFELRHAPWVNPEDLDRYGFAIVCGHDEPWCISGMTTQLQKYPSANLAEVELTRSFAGSANRSQRVLFLFAPPGARALR